MKGNRGIYDLICLLLNKLVNQNGLCSISKNIYDLQKIFLWMRKICHLIKASLFLKTGNAFDQVQVAESKETGVTDVEDALGRYGDSILRLAYSYLHNMSDAEDILQETLIKYMEADRKFESDVHKKAWLLRVAANLSKNKIIIVYVKLTNWKILWLWRNVKIFLLSGMR